MLFPHQLRLEVRNWQYRITYGVMGGEFISFYREVIGFGYILGKRQKRRACVHTSSLAAKGDDPQCFYFHLWWIKPTFIETDNRETPWIVTFSLPRWYPYVRCLCFSQVSDTDSLSPNIGSLEAYTYYISYFPPYQCDITHVII
jgi:hypothetical protein